MATTVEEFEKMLDGEASQNVPRGTNAPASILPLAEDALKQAGAKFLSARSNLRGVMPSAMSDADIATKLGARAGVPLDINEGIPFTTRTGLEMRRDPKDQEEFLTKLYGQGAVRQNSFGDWVVTVADGGQPRDMLANPLGVEWGDLSSVVAQSPEIAGSIIAALRTKGASITPGVWSALKTLAASAAGAETAGLAKDVAVSDRPVGEMTRERAGMAATDMALGAGLGMFTKVATKAVSPFSKYGDLQFDARQAQEFFKDRYGVELPMTPAESTGSMLLQRTEAMAMQKPGSSAPLKALLDERNEKLADIQRIALGGTVPDEEIAGQRAIATLGAKTAPARFEEEAARSALRETGEMELQDVLAAATGSSAPVNKTVLGRGIRDRAFQQRDDFRKESKRLYDEVFNDPLTATKNIAGSPLAKDAKVLLDKLPSKETLTTEPTGLVDEFGTAILRDKKGKEVLREFVPEGVLTKLQTLTSLKDQPFRLDELMAMRREVADDIARGEAIPGVQTKYLSEIQDFLTARIKTGLKELDPSLLAKWTKANDEYAKGVARFKRAGISDLFRDPEQPGFVGDTEIVARATSGRKAQDVYTAYKDFLGAASPEMQQFRRAIADDVLSKSPLSDVIDAGGFVRRIDELAKDAPDVLREVFGINAKKAREVATMLQGADGNIPAREMADVLKTSGSSSAGATAIRLQNLLGAQAKREQLYRNSIIKSVEDGTFKSERIKPTEFVEKMALKAEPSEVTEVMSLLADQPEVTGDIRRLAYQKVLDRATTISRTGEKVLDAAALDKQITNPTDAKRLKAVLGSDTFDLLSKTRDFLRPGAVRDEAFAAAGGMSAGAQIAGLVERGELKYLDRAIKNFVLATVYTSAPLRAYFANTLIGPQGAANAVNLAIASTPFVKATLDTFGEEKGRQVMRQMKMSLDRYVQENPAAGAMPQGQAAQQPTGPMSVDQFEQLLDAP